MGKFFGSREHAPTYIAGVVTLVLLVIMALVILLPASGDLSKLQAVQIIGGFLLAALGYLFGSASGSRRE